MMTDYLSHLGRYRGLILAAGLGTRLRPLSLNAAKPVLPVLGISPLIYNLIQFKAQLSIDDVAINVHHAPKTVVDCIGDSAWNELLPTRLHISDESTELLGSSGVFDPLRAWIGNHALVVSNGDTFCPLNWRLLIKTHEKSKGAMTLHVNTLSMDLQNEAYTEVLVDEHRRVVGFGGKAQGKPYFAGHYVIEPEVIKNLPTGASQLMETCLKPLSDQRRLFGYFTSGQEGVVWLDMGSLNSYHWCHFQLLKLMPDLRNFVLRKMQYSEKFNSWVPVQWKNAEKVLQNAIHQESWDRDADSMFNGVVLYGNEESWRHCTNVISHGFVGFSHSSSHDNHFEQEKLMKNGIWYEDHWLPIR